MKTTQRERKIRNYVIARDGHVCCYCEKELPYEEITMEHIVPESKRGTFNTTNLTVSCAPCNNKRGAKNFFTYCKHFNWSSEKIEKYRKLYFANLKIKVLNLSKETFLQSNIEIPNNIIAKSCQVLKIRDIYFDDYENRYFFSIKFEQPSPRNQIKYCFEQLIKIIESESL